ncbi:lipopolysaccharide biosynthesis protein [Rubricoccus marinus]|uniref:lipopolysaccharide biosynthesis protein n=1 Tax=Rubricoccus marinus TaxID=716817 RepID=UPI002481DE77|nr:lipopolysaccharide biosynthesis protein [Rubricoccus marinus]
MLWMSADRVFLFVVGAVVTAVLARLLPPSDFGIVGAALVVVEIVAQIVSASATPALVQRSRVTRAHLSSAFWLSAGLSLGLFGVVWALSPLAARFFAMPPLAQVLPALALLFVFDGLSAVAQSRQLRDLAFRDAVVIRAVADVIGLGGVSIGLALSGYGLWALVGGRLAQSLLRALGFVIRFPHPVLGATREAARDIARFSGGVVLQGALNSLARQGDALVVGRALGANALGLYNRSYQMMALPASFLAGSFSGVLFPILSKTQDRTASLRATLYRTTSLLALFLLPLAAAAAVLAPEVVYVALGPDWGGAVAPLRILAVGMFFRAAYKTGMTILESRGRIYVAAALQGLYAVLVVIGALVGWPYGLEGVATGVVGAVVVFFGMSTAVAVRETDGTLWPLVRGMAPGAMIAGIGGLLAHAAVVPLRGAGIAPIATLVTGAAVLGSVGLVALAFAPGLIGRHGRWLRSAVTAYLARLGDDGGTSDEPPSEHE